MLAAFSAGKLVFWKLHLPSTLKRSLFSLDHNSVLINFINLLALLLIWRGLWTYRPPTVTIGFILRMFLRLQKTDLVLILLLRFSSRSIAYNLFSGGFTPVGLDWGANQGLFLYIFGLVGFGFTRQLCKQTNGLHVTKLPRIYIKYMSCMFLYFTLIGLLAVGHLMSAGWKLFCSLLVSHNFLFSGGTALKSCCIFSLTSSLQST